MEGRVGETLPLCAEARKGERPASEEKLSSAKAVGNVFVAFVGAGILGLPYAFKQSGSVAGAGFLAAIAFMAWHAILSLSRARAHLAEQGVEATTYGDVAGAALGKPGRTLVDGLLVISQTGFCVAYLVFIGENLHSILPAWHSADGFVLTLLPALVLLSWVRSLVALAPCSLAADALNAYGLLVILQQESPGLADSDVRSIATTGFDRLPMLFGMFIYCFEGIGMMLPLESSMQEPRRFPAVLTLGLAVITGLFIAFGAVGYEAFGEDTQDIITLNLPDGTLLSTSVKSALCLALLMTFPVMLVPVWEIIEPSVLSMAGPATSPGMRAWLLRFVRSLVVVLIATVAVAVPGFGIFISLVGSTACGLLAYVLPGLCHLRIVGHKGMPTWQLVLDLALVVFGMLGGTFGTMNALASAAAADEVALAVAIAAAGAAPPTPPAPPGVTPAPPAATRLTHLTRQHAPLAAGAGGGSTQLLAGLVRRKKAAMANITLPAPPPPMP